MRQLFILMCLVAFLSCFSPGPSNSQVPDDAASSEILSHDSQKPVSADVKGFSPEKYVDPSYENLAHLYWALGILDISRDDIIDNFLLVTECDMYQSYVNNDLEWKEIREATRSFLRENYKIFPTSFKITIPLYLGRYNTEEEFFEVDQNRSKIENVRNIDTLFYTKAVTCGVAGEIEGYPRNLILYLNRPFLLPQLPVERELARLFLDEASKDNNHGAKSRRASRIAAERMAYLELMIRVHSYKETVSTIGMLKAVVFAQVDYIRVYADFDQEKLLYERDMFEEEGRKRKKRINGASLNMNLPEGPLFGTTEKDDKK